MTSLEKCDRCNERYADKNRKSSNAILIVQNSMELILQMNIDIALYVKMINQFYHIMEIV